MTDEFFVLPVEAFHFSKFCEIEAKNDKRSFQRGLNVAFKVKTS